MVATVHSLLQPIKTKSLTEIVVDRLEGLILSGAIDIGTKLPSERELADQLGVSRPVIHEGLLELKARGLVTIEPRVGTVVSDYRREGSLALLTSLLGHGEGSFAPALLQSLLDARALVEVEAAGIAARSRTDEHLAELRAIVAAEASLSPEDDDEAMIRHDFAFHHTISLASGNLVYPLLIKSCEPAYTSLTRQFFSVVGVHTVVVHLHQEILDAIEAHDAPRARSTMIELLDHGREILSSLIAESTSTHQHEVTP